jgi:hypothetical protein
MVAATQCPNLSAGVALGSLHVKADAGCAIDSHSYFKDEIMETLHEAQTHPAQPPRKSAGLFEPVALGMELSVEQHKTVHLTRNNCYEHGFTFKDGRYV